MNYSQKRLFFTTTHPARPVKTGFGRPWPVGQPSAASPCFYAVFMLQYKYRQMTLCFLLEGKHLGQLRATIICAHKRFSHQKCMDIILAHQGHVYLFEDGAFGDDDTGCSPTVRVC
jgi:hypothetical protein